VGRSTVRVGLVNCMLRTRFNVEDADRVVGGGGRTDVVGNGRASYEGGVTEEVGLDVLGVGEVGNSNFFISVGGEDELVVGGELNGCDH